MRSAPERGAREATTPERCSTYLDDPRAEEAAAAGDEHVLRHGENVKDLI
jgi:hypothetical protein